jgi:hypothetical protein
VLSIFGYGRGGISTDVQGLITPNNTGNFDERDRFTSLWDEKQSFPTRTPELVELSSRVDGSKLYGEGTMVMAGMEMRSRIDDRLSSEEQLLELLLHLFRDDR